MLDDAERAELEEFRRKRQQDEQYSRIMGWIVLVPAVLLFGSCTIGAYKADAFISDPATGLYVGVDLTKVYCYLSGKCTNRIVLEERDIPWPPASAASSTGFEWPPTFPVEPPPVPADK